MKRDFSAGEEVLSTLILYLPIPYVTNGMVALVGIIHVNSFISMVRVRPPQCWSVCAIFGDVGQHLP